MSYTKNCNLPERLVSNNSKNLPEITTKVSNCHSHLADKRSLKDAAAVEKSDKAGKRKAAAEATRLAPKPAKRARK